MSWRFLNPWWWLRLRRARRTRRLHQFSRLMRAAYVPVMAPLFDQVSPLMKLIKEREARQE